MQKKSLYKLIAIILVIVFWSLFLFIIGPRRLVELLGADSSLLVTFIVASLGGVSMITAVSFYSTLVTFAAGGVNPYYLGLVGGIGITIGDSLFYYLGKTGRRTLYGRPKKWSQILSDWLNLQPKWIIPLFTFAYAGLAPFPNDILTVSLGLSGVKYRRIVLPLLLGNIFLTIVIAVMASKGWF